MDRIIQTIPDAVAETTAWEIPEPGRMVPERDPLEQEIRLEEKYLLSEAAEPSLGITWVWLSEINNK